MESPVRYAKSGDVHIAYRVFGEGPHDIVLVPGTISHVEIYWELPINAYLSKRLASFARVIVRISMLGQLVPEQTPHQPHRRNRQKELRSAALLATVRPA